MKRTAIVGTAKALDVTAAGTFKFLVSGPKVDREGEVVEVAGLILKSRFPVYGDHQHSMTRLVATCSATVDGENLVVDGKFTGSFEAQFIRSLLDDPDHRDAIGMSIGAIRPKYKLKNGVRTVVEAELIEVSFTGIPAYRDTQLLAVKSGDGAEVVAKDVLTGSLEAQIDDIKIALRDIESESYPYPYLLATFAEYVVYEMWDYSTSSYTKYKRTYSHDDSGLLTLGTAEPVEIQSTIVAVTAATDTAATKAVESSAVIPAASDLVTRYLALARAALALS
jgi:HK97 family phage prohead protease